MATYIISRHGQHPVNQPDREIGILGTVEANDRQHALSLAAAHPEWACATGQYLRASVWKPPAPLYT